MSELSFEQMLEDSVKTIRNGEIVQGTVIDVKEDEIILNIGYKADGIITKNEYSNDASLVLTDAVHVGDTMEAKVLKVNDGEGQVTLTYKRLAAEKGNKRLEEAFENQEVLKAPVSQVLDGGLCVNVDEARVFIPASLVSDTYEKDLSKYADQEIEFVITEFSVDLFDKNFNFIANSEYFLRVLYSAPGHFGDVKKSVCSAKIDECTEICNVLNCSFNCVANMDLLH